MRLVSQQPLNRRQDGSILVICMVIAGIGTIGAAAFFSLIHAKAEETHARETASVRRTQENNGEAVARGAILQRLAGTADGMAIEATTTISSDWGQSQIADYTPAETPLAASANVRLNKSGAVAETAFVSDLEGSVIVNNVKSPKQYQAKSIHPAFAGDLLVVEGQRTTGLPAISFTGNLSVKGRAVFWNSNYAAATASIKADRVILANPTTPKLGLLNTLDEPILPDNLPLPPMTAGFVNGTPRYDGTTQLIGNPNSTLNDYLDSVTPLTGAALSGVTPFVQASGVATNPATVSDGLLLALLGTVTDLTTAVITSLEGASPLSSAVLSSAITVAAGGATTGGGGDDDDDDDDGSGGGGGSTVTSSPELRDLLLLNSPLPNDILSQVVDGTAPLSFDERWEVIRANPVAVAIDAEGNGYLDLDDDSMDHVIIEDGITSLTIRGQEDSAAETAAAAMTPLVVVLCESAGGSLPLTSIQFEGSNYRPLVLALQKYGDNTPVSLAVTSGSAFPEWRAVMDLDNVELEISAATVSTVTFVGGVRTNRTIDVIDGSVVLSRETDGDVIAAVRPMASRNAWVETYAMDP